MNSGQKSSFPLLNAIQEQLHDTQIFKSIKFENNSSKFSTSYDLSFFGPFISLSEKQITCFSLFLPNYLPLIDSRQPEKVMFLLASNQKLQYNFIFPSKDNAKKFYDASITIFENFQPLVQNVNINFCKINEDFIVLLPDSNQIEHSNVFLGFERDSTGSRAVLIIKPINDPKKAKKLKKTSKSKKKENDFRLELKISSKINITQPAEIPKSFGENTFRKVTTEVYQNENEKCLILCKTVEESLNLILSIYFLSHSTLDLSSPKFIEATKSPKVFLISPRASTSLYKSSEPKIIPNPKPKASFLSEMEKDKQIKLPAIEIYPIGKEKQIKGPCLIRPETVIIADDVSVNINQNNKISKNESEKSHVPTTQKSNNDEINDDFILQFEEVIVSNSKESKLSQRLIDYERSARSRTNTLSRKNSQNNPRRRSTVKRRGNINLESIRKKEDKNDENDNNDEIDFSYFKPNNASSTDFDGNCEKNLENISKMIGFLEKERKKAEKNQSIEDSLPDFDTFIKGMSSTKSEMIIQGDASVNAQLEKSFEILQSNSYDDHFTSFKQSSKKLEKTDEIVQKSIEFFSDISIEPEKDIKCEAKFFEFFDFNSYPSYNHEEFELSIEPHLEFLDKLVNIIQSIEVKKITKLYSDTGDQIGQNLTALVAALFINGLRGFDRVNDISSRDYEVCINLANSMKVISGSVPGLIGIVNQLFKMINFENGSNSCDIATLASALAVLMLNEGIFINFLRAIQKNDDWINRFYFPTSIMASSNLINMCIVLLIPLFCNTQFLLSIESSGSCLFNKSANFIDTIVKTPAQGFLEVDPFILLSMGPSSSILASSLSNSSTSFLSTSNSGNVPPSISSMNSLPRLQFDLTDTKNAADFRSAFHHSIVHQFSFGLKPSFIKIQDAQRQFSFINEVSTSSIQPGPKSKNRAEWKEFVETTKLLKNTNGMMIKEMSYVIEEWVSIGLEKKMLHIWLLFLGVNTDIVNKFYYPSSTFADPYRLKFVVKAIVKFYKSMDQIKAT